MMKKLLAALMCTALMMALLPLAAYAADGDITYLDENGATQTTEGLTVTPITAGTASLTSGWYVVDSNVTRNGTITVSGNVNLILMDGFTLSVTGSPDNAGMRVSPGNSLSIYGQAGGIGTLTTQGGPNGAGIGSGKYTTSGSPCGTININGGTVNATGGSSGAGIGGGLRGSGGTITLNGGTIYATGGTNSAGIGGGYNAVSNMDYSSGGTITITGGNVTANGNEGGAGIGGGMLGSSGTISISGGNVNATSGDVTAAAGPAGIGGGRGRGVTKITISGGTVVASALDRGAGIGGGSSGNGGTIEISGGCVTATSNGYGAGIGGGDTASGGTTTISGGTVIATSEYGGAGIGGGYLAAGGTINILGGDISAFGVLWGAGIGSGGSGNAGAITISGGTVKAFGGDYGAGIGAGGKSSAGSHNGGTIKILGGKVTARGGASGMDAGLDIGRGRNGINGTVLIDDASQVTLTANGIDSSVTTLGTCILQGSPAGSLRGAYEDGEKIDGTLIDVSNPTLPSGAGYTVSGNTVTLTGSGNSYVLFGSTTSRNVVVSSGSSANVTLFAADIQPASGCAFNMSGATVNMRLVGVNTLTSTSDFAGLQAPAGSTLTILSDSTGTLTTQGGTDSAGIGGSSKNSGGAITINSGTVIATGGSRGAGIGGGWYYTTGGTITINGGTVTARGGTGAAGVGGGDRGSGGSITINGGTVEAWGGAASSQSGAGIGGGVYGNGGSITISGGTVTAWGGGDGAGIGGGQSRSGGNITISGGTVTANGGSYGAGIGGGYESDAGIIIISGGTVMAQGSNQGAGIGCGGCGGSGGSVAISGGTITAYGGSRGYSGGGGAGIGGGGASGNGNGGASSSVTINGSATVTARGSDGGAGIGGGGADSGVGGAGGTVLADGENTTVSATGGGNGYDIGSGSGNSSGGSLAIQNSATVNLNRNGTNANDNFVTGTIGGDGAGFLAGTYLNSQKLLTCSSVTASPSSGANAFDNVTLTASVTGLFIPEPQGQITFFDNGSKIGQASLTRKAAGSADATADFIWSSRGGSHTLTAQYVQHETADSYYMTNDGELGGYLVAKIEQASLSISGIPDTVTYGDASFMLSVNGGSGTGTGLGYSVTSGDAVSVNISGVVTVEKAGQSTITITKAGDDNYLPVSADVTITVNKAIPPTVVFPSASTITYEQQLSDSTLTGGSGDGTFAWENSITVPPVINTGYNVIFTPNDTDNYDYTGFVLTKNVSITVNKATPVVTFPTADEITYEQPLSHSELTGGIGDGSFAWESPATIPTVVNSGYRVVFTPDDTDNYLTTSEIVDITVQKASQAAIIVGGIPGTVTYGDSSFDLSGNGGSGTGAFSYSVASGDAVSVSTSGTVTVLKAGTAQITATKAGDTNYLPVSTNVTMTVNKAVPTVVYPTAARLTYGQLLSDSALTGGSGVGTFTWENPDTLPTVINTGYNVEFTPNDTDNYLTMKRVVAIVVNKAVQTPLTVSGIPDTLTFGDAPFKLSVSGGSGTGSLSFAVITGNAVTVDSSGKVTIAHGGTAIIKVTNTGDDNYLPISRTVPFTVNKAAQTTALSFTLPESIAYGDTPFQIIDSGGSGSGAYSYQVASGSAVAVSTTGTVTVLRPGEAVITAVKAVDTDYLSQEKTLQISVGKGTQSALVINGIPSRITSGGAPFGLVVNGGSGSGIVSYAVTSGRAVSVDTGGTVTILRPGTAVLTVTKAEDDYYLATTATVEISVRKATSAEDISATSAAPSSTFTSSPTATAMPSPTATDASPSQAESPEPVTLKPLSMKTDESTGIFTATINIDDLPEGTASIKLASGEIIQIDSSQSTLELPISQDDLNEDGELVIVALDEENTPLGNYQLDLSDDVWQAGSTDDGTGTVSTLVWFAAGVLVMGAASVVIVRWFKKVK